MALSDIYYRPYEPYKSPSDSFFKAQAGLQGNISQGKVPTDWGRLAEQIAKQTYERLAPSLAYGYSVFSRPSPWPVTQNPPIYQAPIGAPKANYEKAIQDAPESGKDIARWILDAYRQFLGREADEPGYLAHFRRFWGERQAGKPVTWETIAREIATSEEGRRARAMRDVDLAIQPEIFRRAQERQHWMLEQALRKAELEREFAEKYGLYTTDYERALEDLARQMAQQRQQQELLHARRGLWESGILDAALRQIEQQADLAQARLGTEFLRNLGNLVTTYGTELGGLLAREALYGKQFEEAIAELMGRREALVQRALDQLMEQLEEERWRQKAFDWEREKFYTQLAQQMRLAQMTRGGGGGGGRYYGGGGGGGGDVNLSALDKFLQQSRLIIEQGGDIGDIINIFDQAFYGGGRPGLDTRGITRRDWDIIRSLVVDPETNLPVPSSPITNALSSLILGRESGKQLVQRVNQVMDIVNLAKRALGK